MKWSKRGVAQLG